MKSPKDELLCMRRKCVEEKKVRFQRREAGARGAAGIWESAKMSTVWLGSGRGEASVCPSYSVAGKGVF